jgi:hypothetical protein
MIVCVPDQIQELLSSPWSGVSLERRLVFSKLFCQLVEHYALNDYVDKRNSQSD